MTSELKKPSLCWRNWLLGIVALSAGCGADPSAHRLTITGSSTMAPLITEVAAQFEASQPGLRVDVQTGGSSRGIRDASQGAADLGMASRALKDDEAQQLLAEVVGWDGVAFMVHADNPVVSLDAAQLIGIYTGAVDHWLPLGGADAPIVVSNRAAGRSELELVAKHLGLDVAEMRADVVDGETMQAIKTVSTNVHAIAYGSLGAAQHAIDQGTPLRLLPLDGVPASLDAVRAGRYPLARPLLLLQSRGNENQWAREFVRYALSSKVDDLTLGLGYVPPERH